VGDVGRGGGGKDDEKRQKRWVDAKLGAISRDVTTKGGIQTSGTATSGMKLPVHGLFQVERRCGGSSKKRSCHLDGGGKGG